MKCLSESFSLKISLLNIPGSPLRCCHFGSELAAKYLTWLSRETTHDNSAGTWRVWASLQNIICIYASLTTHHSILNLSCQNKFVRLEAYLLMYLSDWLKCGFPLCALCNLAHLSPLISPSFFLCLYKNLMFSVFLFILYLKHLWVDWQTFVFQKQVIKYERLIQDQFLLYNNKTKFNDISNYHTEYLWIYFGQIVYERVTKLHEQDL